MVKIKVSRRGELDNAGAILFVGESDNGDDYTVNAFISDNGENATPYTAYYNQKEWTKLREEGGFETNEEFIKELGDTNNSFALNHSEHGKNSVEAIWNKPDEDGLTFEFCTMMLNSKKTIGVYGVIDALLQERDIYREKAANGDAAVSDMEGKLEKIEKRVLEMNEYCKSLTNTLISKFVAIQNAKSNS